MFASKWVENKWLGICLPFILKKIISGVYYAHFTPITQTINAWLFPSQIQLQTHKTVSKSNCNHNIRNRLTRFI